MEYKGYEIDMDGFGLRSIRPQGRGSVTKALRGKFTKPILAMEAIDKHEASKVKGKADGETASSS